MITDLQQFSCSASFCTLLRCFSVACHLQSSSWGPLRSSSQTFSLRAPLCGSSYLRLIVDWIGQSVVAWVYPHYGPSFPSVFCRQERMPWTTARHHWHLVSYLAIFPWTYIGRLSYHRIFVLLYRLISMSDYRQFDPFFFWWDLQIESDQSLVSVMNLKEVWVSKIYLSSLIFCDCDLFSNPFPSIFLQLRFSFVQCCLNHLSISI